MEAMERCSGKPSRAAILSFDIQKAFDSISHQRTLDHLRNHFNLSLNGRKWLQEFLTNRSFCVRVGLTLSQWSVPSRGVPQGTVLGPIIFNAATAELKNLPLTTGSTIILYADDLLLIKCLPSQEDEYDLQKDCNTINSFYEKEDLKLNGSKTQLLLASVSPGGASELQRAITVAGNQVTRTKELKYLGILLDERMNLVKHTTWVSGKARKMLGAVRNILKRWQLTRQIERIYLCCIRPIISYSVSVSYPKTKEGQRMIERVNKIAAEMVLNKFDRNYDDLLSTLKWDSIKWSGIQEQLRIMHQSTQQVSSSSRIQLVERENTRHSQRLSNNNPFKVIGKPPHLNRTRETAVHQMVRRWNILPNDVVNASKNVFITKISSPNIKILLIENEH
jgi:hypothetical protein